VASGESWGRLARARTCGPYVAAGRTRLATRAAVRTTPGRQNAPPVLRIVHTADVHLGARHADMGDKAAAQRERQFAAFKATVDLALEERVDLFLIAGDLFDSNTQPRRSAERVGAELARLAAAKVRTVIIPGTHDVYERASIYRAYDLEALAGSDPEDDFVTVLTPDRPWVHLSACDVVVFGPVFATKKAPKSPLDGLDTSVVPEATYRVGMVHGAVAIPGKTDGDDVVVTTQQIAASGLDYLALGHWHSAQQARAGNVTYAYAGAPEPVAIDQDRAGKALLVELDSKAGSKTVTVSERQVGKTRFDKVRIDAAAIASQPAFIEGVAKRADPDLVLDVRIDGVRPDELDLHLDEIETALAPSFLGIRVRDASLPALTEGALPSPDTIAGSFIRDVEASIAQLEAAGQADEAAEARDVLRLGRLLLAGHEVSL
jgi:DNA repair exonuclease SbcCD nuclease subunit